MKDFHEQVIIEPLHLLEVNDMLDVGEELAALQVLVGICPRPSKTKIHRVASRKGELHLLTEFGSCSYSSHIKALLKAFERHLKGI